MGVVVVAPVREQRVDHLEEPPLQSRRLGGGVQGRRSRVLAPHREVAEDDAPPRGGGDPAPGRGAVRAAEVRVDDQVGALAPGVVVGADGRDGGAGQVALRRGARLRRSER